MKKNKPELKMIKHQVITDQADSRMQNFRKSRGEFEPGCKQETVKLEITEYVSEPDKLKVTTQFGYYKGEPPPRQKEIFRKLYRAILK